MVTKLIICVVAFVAGIGVGKIIEKSPYKPIGSSDETQKEKNEKELVAKNEDIDETDKKENIQ